MATPGWAHPSGPGPTASTIPCWGGGSLDPSGTTRPERRTRSGSSSLMTTRSKRGFSCCCIGSDPFKDRPEDDDRCNGDAREQAHEAEALRVRGEVVRVRRGQEEPQVAEHE